MNKDDLEYIKKLSGLNDNDIAGNFFNIKLSKKYILENFNKVKKQSLNEFANSKKSGSRMNSDAPVIDRPKTDVTDLTSSRNELLRIMKLAGQSAGDSKKPGGWNLVLYNDSITPGQAVYEGLQSVLGMNEGEINRVIYECHSRGKSVLATYAIEDKALKMRDQLKHSIDNNRNYPGGNGTYGPWNVRLEVLKAG